MRSSSLLKLYVFAPLCLLLAFIQHANASAGVQIQYFSNQEFLDYAFPNSKPESKLLILNSELKSKAEEILHHKYHGRRIRYWQEGGKTVWILDEIGKELPITMGFIIEENHITEIKLLVYREERGGEVHEKFFMDQFDGAILTQNHNLDRDIDGITGATLSVDAVTRVAALSLMLNEYVNNKSS